MNEIKKWTFKITPGNILIILLGIGVNLLGRHAATALFLPIWLDSVGTFMTAVELGPIAGVITGTLMNVIENIYEPGYGWFAIVSIGGAIAVGRFFPRHRKVTSFSVIATGFLAGVVMTILSTPVNFLVRDGYVGNAWGDALVALLSKYMNVRWVRLVAGELLVNMPDKVVSVLLAMLLLIPIRAIKKKNKKASVNQAVSLLLLSLLCALSLVQPVQARKDDHKKEDYKTESLCLIYGMEDGLASAEINAIAQTSDGYIWAGAYSGLYRYNGSRFEQVTLDEKISSVTCLYEDEHSRLWIGTNDSGVACYDVATEKIDFYSTKNGLASDSVRSVCEDEDGNVYVSTMAELFKVDSKGAVRIYKEYPELSGVYSLKKMKGGNVIGVTATGAMFALKNDELQCMKMLEEPEVAFTAVDSASDGTLLIGTTADHVYRATIAEDGRLELGKRIELPDFSYVNYIQRGKSDDGFFVCGSSGLAFVGDNSAVTDLTVDGFDNSVSCVITDYQDNVWFSSTKQGIMKLTYTPFRNISLKAGLDEPVVNALAIEDGKLYIGTDDGLEIVDIASGNHVTEDVETIFEKTRIRHLMKDSKGNKWVSTYGQTGLVCIAKDGTVTTYNGKSGDVLGSRFRFTKELSDGTIMAVSTDGLNYIKNGKVTHTLGSEDGLVVPHILSLVETADGELLAGSDGDGIYRIKDGVLVGHIGADEGLESPVVMKIVPTEGGYFYVTSNALFYDDGPGKVRRLKAFPYNNNYDIYVSGKGEAWVTGSAGIHVVRVEDLIKDEEYSYILLNRIRGFDTTLTANAWNVTDGDTLYLCCTDGVRCVDTVHYNNLNDHYKIVLASIKVDDEEIRCEDGVYQLPSGEGRLQLVPAVLNYAASNPLVNVYMEGTDDPGMRLRQSEMTGNYVTTLPYGDYKIHVQVIDELSGTVKKEQVFSLHKDAELYEYFYYKLYLFLVGGMIAGFFAWMIAKMSNMAVINRQYDEIRAAKEEAEYANQAKSRFLANMSHEIRTPINAVLGMDEMILRESSEPEIRGYAADIYTAGNTLLSLINDILDSSKIESGKMEIVPVDYDLKTLIRDLNNMISQRAQAKDLTMHVEVQEDLPSSLHGDDVRLRQVVTNILTNAVKYTQTGDVWFRVNAAANEKAAQDEITLRFEVEDTGIGIKEEDLPKLFEAFQRIEEGRNRNIEGTGLGMNITLQLLSMMDSKLEVESVYGKGSKFWFEIKQKVTDPSPVGNINEWEQSSDADYRHTGAFIAPEAKVLVVDDNAMNRKVFKSLLKTTQIQVTEADSGKASLELAKETRFDLVFMDHMMPEMDGVTAMQLMREIPGYDEIPILALTANALTGAREQYLSAGFDGFISKPVVSEKLEQALAEMLPKELLLPYKGSEGESARTAPACAPTEELPAIDGLDWDYAWMHLPDKELLLSAVETFREVIGSQAEKLEKMCGDLKSAQDETTRTEAFTAYRIQVHGMKSAAATVGIVPLAGMAKVLEYAAADGNETIIFDMHKVFLDEWYGYFEKLREFGGEAEPGDTADEKERADSDVIRAMTEMLKNALLDFDIDAADGIIDRIKTYSYGPEIEALMEELIPAARDMDQDKAEAIMNRIENLL